MYLTNPATLHYSTLSIQRLIFLQTDVNLIFLIIAVMQQDPRSSTPKCEVFFNRRYGCQHENTCHCARLTVKWTGAVISTGRNPRVVVSSGSMYKLVSTALFQLWYEKKKKAPEVLSVSCS